jgi:hypothetical protein
VGKMLLVGRLVGRDLRYRTAQAVLLLLAIAAATTVLSLALALHGVTNKPYQQTRAATRGPDVVAVFAGGGVLTTRHGPALPSKTPRSLQAEVKSLTSARGVTGHAGPYPVGSAVLRVGTVTAPVQAEGREQAPASIDQPRLTAGSWVRPDGIVLERTFAAALGASVGERVTLDGHPYTVVGIAVTAASPPYPNMCFPPAGECVAGLPMTCNGDVCSAYGET